MDRDKIEEERLEKQKLRNKNLIKVFFLIFFIGIISVVIIITKENQSYNPNNFTEAQLQCLVDQYQFYGADWCSHCRDQKQIIGAIAYENPGIYTDCDINKVACYENIKVEAFPTTITFNKNTGAAQKVTGVLSLGKIEELTGCDLIK